MCQLTPLNHANVNGPAYDHANPRARVAASRESRAREAYWRGPDLRLRTDETMIATFQNSTATMAKPAILWTAMNMASPAEPDTSPKNPVRSSTSSRVSRMLFAQKDFILYTIQRTGTLLRCVAGVLLSHIQVSGVPTGPEEGTTEAALDIISWSRVISTSSCSTAVAT